MLNVYYWGLFLLICNLIVRLFCPLGCSSKDAQSISWVWAECWWKWQYQEADTITWSWLRHNVFSVAGASVFLWIVFISSTIIENFTKVMPRFHLLYFFFKFSFCSQSHGPTPTSLGVGTKASWQYAFSCSSGALQCSCLQCLFICINIPPFLRDP